MFCCFCNMLQNGPVVYSVKTRENLFISLLSLWQTAQNSYPDAISTAFS